MRIVKLNIEKGKTHKFGDNTITRSQDITEDISQKVKTDIERIIKANPLFSGESEESKLHLENFEKQHGFAFNYENLLIREIKNAAKKSKMIIILENESDLKLYTDSGISYIYYQAAPIIIKEEKAKK